MSQFNYKIKEIFIYNEVKESSIYYNILHPSHGKHMMAPYQKVDKWCQDSV